MKRRYMLLILLIIIAVYISVWFFTPTRFLSFHLHDKTVPEPVDYREHKEFYYLAKHWRFTNQMDEFFDYAKDYSGYHPEDENRKERLTEELIGDARLLYLADTYGIYDYEEGLIDYEEKLPFELIDIDLLFGGFDEEETKVIQNFSEKPGKILIGEHNVFGYPTYLYEGSSAAIQEIFGVKYDGWLVRYYEDLTEVAYWVKLLYTRIFGQEFDSEGPGLVVVREDASRSGWYGELLIFKPEDFKQQYPVITNVDNNVFTEKASSGVPYLYWIEVLEVTNENAEVLAYYEFPLKEEALEKLKTRGIEPLIPVFIHLDEPNKAQKFYFAGDFVDQTSAILPNWLTGSLAIQRAVTYLPGVPPQYSFYFRWYAPVLKNILELAAD